MWNLHFISFFVGFDKSPIFLYICGLKVLNHFTAPWARRSHCTWRWASARHRPCVRPGPCRTSSAQTPWCQCNGRTGTWGTSCGGRSWAPEEDPYTTGRARLTGRGWGRPSCWNKVRDNFNHSRIQKQREDQKYKWSHLLVQEVDSQQTQTQQTQTYTLHSTVISSLQGDNNCVCLVKLIIGQYANKYILMFFDIEKKGFTLYVPLPGSLFITGDIFNILSHDAQQFVGSHLHIREHENVWYCFPGYEILLSAKQANAAFICMYVLCDSRDFNVAQVQTEHSFSSGRALSLSWWASVVSFLLHNHWLTVLCVCCSSRRHPDLEVFTDPPEAEDPRPELVSVRVWIHTCVRSVRSDSVSEVPRSV